MLAADVLNQPSLAVSTDPSELDVDNAAGAQLNRAGCVTGVMNALVETNRSFDLRLQFDVRINVVPVQGLLNHEQIKLIELF